MKLILIYSHFIRFNNNVCHIRTQYKYFTTREMKVTTESLVRLYQVSMSACELTCVRAVQNVPSSGKMKTLDTFWIKILYFALAVDCSI